MKKLKYFTLSVMLLIVALSAYGQEPTQIGPGGSWTSARGIINTNMTQVYDSLQSLRYSTNLNYSFIESHADSITAHTAKIALRLLKTDTASMLSNYTRNGELNSALAAKLNVSDTSAMLAHYALTSELGDAGTSIGDVRDEIADSLNVLRPLYVAIADTATMLDPYAKLTDLSEGGIGIGAVQDEIADSLNVLRAAVTVGNGTKAPYFDGSQDGGQILYFYGDNGFYTALQGGAPTANRSYRLPIDTLPPAGTTSLLNIDEYGNMGFVAQSTVGSNLLTLTNPSAITFLRINANNTVDALSAANFKTALSLAASDVSLGNVTNESKATMFTSPIFTGTVPRLGSPVTDSLATRAYARSVGGGDVSALETRIDSIVGVLADTANIEAILQVDLDTDTLSTKAYARSVGELLSGAVSVADSTGTAEGSYVTGYDFVTAMQNQVHLADSTGNAPGNYVTRKALIDSIAANVGSIAGITLNSGTITLNGSEGTADDITFYTNGDGSYDLPAGGGNLTIMSQVQGWINDTADVIRTEAKMIDDTSPYFLFGAGIGEPADSISFSKGKRGFGAFKVTQDSLHIVDLRNIVISANDSLLFNVYYGNRMTATPVDSLFTGPQSCGDNQTTFTPNNQSTIAPGNDVWIELRADQPEGYRPKEWNLQLNTQIRRL